MSETWKEYTQKIHESFTTQSPLIGGQGTPNEVFFLALALSGEVGELGNILKKRWRGDGPIDDVKPALRSELADVRVYLEHLSRALGVDLDEACEEKCQELRSRWPERCSDSA